MTRWRPTWVNVSNPSYFRLDGASLDEWLDIQAMFDKGIRVDTSRDTEPRIKYEPPKESELPATFGPAKSCFAFSTMAMAIVKVTGTEERKHNEDHERHQADSTTNVDLRG